MDVLWPSVGRAGISERLRRFVNEMPYERGPIFDFMERSAALMPGGADVLDVGAGEAPYRELFAHTNYTTLDWANSPHDEAMSSDLIASAEQIPLDDEICDAVLLTQVLEHVPEPLRLLCELRRILKVGGWLFLTAPLVWELHELPFDFFRYTANGLTHLLTKADFIDVDITPRNDAFTTVAQLMRNVAAMANEAAANGGGEGLRDAASNLWRLSADVASFAPLDQAFTLPLGYAVAARRG